MNKRTSVFLWNDKNSWGSTVSGSRLNLFCWAKDKSMDNKQLYTAVCLSLSLSHISLQQHTHTPRHYRVMKHLVDTWAVLSCVQLHQYAGDARERTNVPHAPRLAFKLAPPTHRVAKRRQTTCLLINRYHYKRLNSTGTDTESILITGVLGCPYYEVSCANRLDRFIAE